jgi:hypothetical protein
MNFSSQAKTTIEKNAADRAFIPTTAQQYKKKHRECKYISLDLIQQIVSCSRSWNHVIICNYKNERDDDILTKKHNAKLDSFLSAIMKTKNAT